jgi:SAM-dependent methyltransferase
MKLIKLKKIFKKNKQFTAVIRLILKLKNYFWFISTYKKYKKLADNRFKIRWYNRYPCLSERTKYTNYDKHYVYHTAWAARILKKINPTIHYDFSSDIRFVTIISAFIPVRYYDIRPVKIHLSGIEPMAADLTDLTFKSNSLMSVSCMHVIEHIGLGRYGDPIDPNSDIKAVKELKRVLAKDGNLLFVVPVGKQRLMFNAHRIYSYRMVIDMFKEFKLIEFSLITHKEMESGLIKNPTFSFINKQEYACGCFWFKK